MILNERGVQTGTVVGMARIGREIFQGHDLTALWTALSERVAQDETDADAFYDLSLILQLRGETEQGRHLQARALSTKACFTCIHGTGAGLSVLVFVSGQDMTSNTPVDFLLTQTDFTVHYLYVDALCGEALPAHDLAFMAVGESVANRPFLAALGPVLEAWAQPVVNGQPDRILAMTRDEVSAALQGCALIAAPRNVLLTRDEVNDLAHGIGAALGPFGEGSSVLIRPIDTDCGRGLERVASLPGLGDYLQRHPEEHFHLAPFVDYSGPDGLFRNQRITFIDGAAFPAHMAISNHWMVHYLNAGMTESADKRREEERWMETFHTDFAVRHANAFAALHERIGADYFSIDCAETPDGRLLFFEADIAAIVHNLDCTQMFPYKQKHMARLFSAFEAMLLARARVGERAIAA